jgi:hypothetical protein
MKKGILAFKAMIRFIVSIVTSREFAFLYCLTGTIAQISHTYFLVQSISSLDGYWRIVQATMLSIFISSSLLYFVSIADDEDSEASRKVHRTITLFTVIEVVINVYYYTRHILIDPLVLSKDPNLTGYFDLAFALMISVMIPITIKLYASSIRAKDWIEDIEHGREATVSADLRENADYLMAGRRSADGSYETVPATDNKKWAGETYDPEPNAATAVQRDEVTDDDIERVMKPLVEAFQNELLSLRKNETEVDEAMVASMVQKVLDEKVSTLDEKLTQAFERNSGLFIKQFDNKIKQIMNKGLTDIKTPPDQRVISEGNNKDNEQ